MSKELTAEQCANILRWELDPENAKDVCPACFKQKDRINARCCKPCRKQYQNDFKKGKSTYAMYVAMKRWALLHQLEFDLSGDALQARGHLNHEKTKKK